MIHDFYVLVVGQVVLHNGPNSQNFGKVWRTHNMFIFFS